jgi:hypothetical protein
MEMMGTLEIKIEVREGENTRYVLITRKHYISRQEALAYKNTFQLENLKLAGWAVFIWQPVKKVI